MPDEPTGNHRGICAECGDLWPCDAFTQQIRRSSVLSAIHDRSFSVVHEHEGTWVEATNAWGVHRLPIDDEDVIAAFREDGWTIDEHGMRSPPLRRLA